LPSILNTTPLYLGEAFLRGHTVAMCETLMADISEKHVTGETTVIYVCVVVVFVCSSEWQTRRLLLVTHTRRVLAGRVLTASTTTTQVPTKTLTSVGRSLAAVNLGRVAALASCRLLVTR